MDVGSSSSTGPKHSLTKSLDSANQHIQGTSQSASGLEWPFATVCFIKFGMGEIPHIIPEFFLLIVIFMTAVNIPKTGESDSATVQREPNPRHRILVVDGDPYIRHFSPEVLIRHGREVNAAEDGAAAGEELQANKYNLLITDQQIPKVSGVELLKKIHATRMALPVVMAISTLPTRKFALLPWLQPATILRKPHAFEKLSGIVKDVFYATAIVRGEIAPPAAVRLRP
jgi:CheY-like chemotaxis protein